MRYGLIVDSLKRARRARAMSLSDVAAACGLHPEAIARAERTEVDPRASTVAAIARALGVPVCEVFEESGHAKRRRRRSKA